MTTVILILFFSLHFAFQLFYNDHLLPRMEKVMKCVLKKKKKKERRKERRRKERKGRRERGKGEREESHLLKWTKTGYFCRALKPLIEKDKSQINQLFCLHGIKHYWFYFFKEYLELISYFGIMEAHHHVNEDNIWATGEGHRPCGMTSSDLGGLRHRTHQCSLNFRNEHLLNISPESQYVPDNGKYLIL